MPRSRRTAPPTVRNRRGYKWSPPSKETAVQAWSRWGRYAGGERSYHRRASLPNSHRVTTNMASWPFRARFTSDDQVAAILRGKQMGCEGGKVRSLVADQ